MPLEQQQTRILDTVNKILWCSAPWRWSMAALTAITVASNTQDYTLAPPADFLYLLHSYVSDGVSVPRHLTVVPSLPASVVVKGVPEFISYEGNDTFRISPNPGVQISPTKQIISWYKKQAPTITASNQMTAGTLIFDDEYFPVYQAGVLWLAYLFGDDSRSGSAQIDANGRASYTGQKAVFEAGIQAMRESEPMPVFDFKNYNEQKDMK